MVYRKIKVGVLIRAPYIYRTKTDGNDHYSGFLFEVWQLIAKQNKLTSVYTTIEGSNYSKIMREQGDKFDVIIGNISNSVNRYNYVNFSNPIKINKIGIMRKKKFKTLSFLMKFVKNLTIPLIILVTTGIVLGLVLWYMDPDRTFVENEMGKKLTTGWRKPLLSTVASMFGEMGGVVERSDLSFYSISAILIIMIISYFSTIYFQAMTIGDMISFDNDSIIDSKGIKNINIITIKGTALAKVVKSAGAKVEFTKAKNVTGFLDYYRENIDKYDGLLLDYDTMLNIEKKHPDLVIDPHVFGYDDIQFAVSKNNFQLLSKINRSILELQSSLKIKKICAKYVGTDPAQCVI